tara:strand:- start:2606 stop:4189 length:1584 start_codon:yes stop_codon:yes gene_type:complete
MKNRTNYIIISIIFFINFTLLGIETDSENRLKLLNTYIKKFQQNNNNYENLKKIEEILIEEKNFELLIQFYETYIDNINDIKHKFESEVKILEFKIWNKDNNWINDLYELEKKYNSELNNQAKHEYVLHILFKNKKINEGYEFILFIRDKYKLPHFFSKKLINIFRNNMLYKESINESIIYLTKTPNIKKQSKISQQIVVDQIFDLLNKLFLNEIHKNKNLPISYKQFSSNTFLKLRKPIKHINIDVIEYIIDIYNQLITHQLSTHKAKIKLAEIEFEILNDLDQSYKMYDAIQKESSKISIDAMAVIGKADILISKGYLDSAMTLIKQQKKIVEKINKHDLVEKINYKYIQILFYKGEYSKMHLEIDSLINNAELKNTKYNDLLELKMISLFFKDNINEYKKYSSIQYKMKMNKGFESLLELIELINSENILISELAQFQYALIEFQKGNFENTQKFIKEMDTKTVFYEIALILNAEIEDYINQNYEEAIKLYENFIEQYPNSIHKENILKRLNEINKIIEEDIEL